MITRALSDQGMSQRPMSELLGVSVGTVNADLKADLKAGVQKLSTSEDDHEYLLSDRDTLRRCGATEDQLDDDVFWAHFSDVVNCGGGGTDDEIRAAIEEAARNQAAGDFSYDKPKPRSRGADGKTYPRESKKRDAKPAWSATRAPTGKQLDELPDRPPGLAPEREVSEEMLAEWITARPGAVPVRLPSKPMLSGRPSPSGRACAARPWRRKAVSAARGTPTSWSCWRTSRRR